MCEDVELLAGFGDRLGGWDDELIKLPPQQTTEPEDQVAFCDTSG